MLTVEGWRPGTRRVRAKVSLEPLLRPRVNCSLPRTLFDAAISVSFVKGAMYNLDWLVDQLIDVLFSVYCKTQHFSPIHDS